MCMWCVSAKGDNPCEPIYLSKEEVGEILVRETERRRFRASAEIPHLSQLQPAVPQKTTGADHTCSKYEDLLRQQLKTFSARDNNRWDNVNIPNGVDEKTKTQALKCLPIISRHGQKDDLLKMTEVLESISCSGRTSICHNSCSTADNIIITGECTPATQQYIDNIENSSKVVCPVSIISTDSCAARPHNDRLRLDADVTSVEASRVTGRAQKKKKTVTFSDNVELVASAGDVADPVDYMSYAASIGRQANSAVSNVDSLVATRNRVDTPVNCCTVSDVVTTSDSSDEVDEENCATPTGQVRCSLCRQKWIELTDTYCCDCSFYLSKLQMSH